MAPRARGRSRSCLPGGRKRPCAASTRSSPRGSWRCGAPRDRCPTRPRRSRSFRRRLSGSSRKSARSNKHQRGGTLYELLEVDPTAAPDTIKAAFFQLAKRLHPDHRSGLKLDDADGVLDDLYLRVKDAYEILSSETERRRYDFVLSLKTEREARAQETAAANPAPKGRSQPAPPVPAPDAKKTFTTLQTARIHFGNGERYFGDGRYHEAIEELRTAVRLDPSRAEYHRALGLALSKNPKWRKQAEDALSKALELNRFDADSYVGLGELYHEGGLETRARKMFEEALALDPSVHALERLASGRPKLRVSG
jgi:curved DNA-binding protein CbpA